MTEGKWNEDPELWVCLDEMMKNVKPDLNRFLTILYKYQSDLDLLGNAVMFGGIGKLVLMYNQFRIENEPEQSLAMAFKEMHNDRRVQQLIGHAVNTAIDGKVSQMRGEA